MLLKDCDPNFIQEVIKAGGKNAQVCFECGTCSGGCPVAYAMDYTPRQTLRMVELGMRKEVLQSGTIWTCAACQTCTTRCPRGVELSHIMSAIKSIAIKEGVPPKNPMGPAFYMSFTEIAKGNGRLFEAMLMLKFVLRSEFWPTPTKFTWRKIFNPALAIGAVIGTIKRLMKDMPLGLKLIKKGKMEIMPHKIKGIAQLQRISENVRKIEMEAEK
ncbi:MAG: 4Fe-4S dicluster domain-containing protein [Candidatus Hydrothermarchaeales archaeon]